jgi:acetolactate synthase I/III small subunit
MGEPGTKEVLNLEDLQASGGMLSGRKHVLSLLVENKPGVLEIGRASCRERVFRNV